MKSSGAWRGWFTFGSLWCTFGVPLVYLLCFARGVPAQDTYDMQWSFMGDVLLTTDASRALKLIDIRCSGVSCIVAFPTVSTRRHVSAWTQCREKSV